MSPFFLSYYFFSLFFFFLTKICVITIWFDLYKFVQSKLNFFFEI